MVEVLVKFVILAFVLGVDVVVPGAASDILWTSWGEEGACFRGGLFVSDLSCGRGLFARLKDACSWGS